MGGYSTDDASQYCVTQNASGTTSTDDGLNRSGKSKVYQVELISTGAHFVVDGYPRRWVNTNVPPSPSTIVLASQTNKGNLVVDWVRVRKYVATQPELDPVYDLAKLDPENIDIQMGIDKAYIQLKCTFPHKNIPAKGSRLIYKVSGTDCTDLLLFYGKVVTIDTEYGYSETTMDVLAADDMINLSKQRVHWFDSHMGDGLIYEDQMQDELTYSAAYRTNVLNGNVHNPAITDPGVVYDVKTTKYECLETLLDHFGCLYKTRFNEGGSGINEYIDVNTPANIDISNSGFYLNDPITLDNSSYVVDKPEITHEVDDNYNKVTIYSGTSACAATIYEEYAGKVDTNEYVNEDNGLTRKNSTVQTEAIKWLLYFSSKRYTVKIKLKDHFAFQLYQRIKFGSDFPEELQNLTNSESVESVYIYNPANSTPVNNRDPRFEFYDIITWSEIDVSGVPTPSWLRITGIHYYKSNSDEYMELTAVTDFIYSDADPEIQLPYSTYLKPGFVKPVIGGYISQVETMIDKTLSMSPFADYGTVQSVAGNGLSAVVNTDTGKEVTVKTVSASTVGKRVLVVPDGKGNYYIATFA
jgi:hypothetical protein